MNPSPHASAPRPRPSPRPSQHNGTNLNTPRYRPATIAELADRARDDHWDPSRGVKYWLKTGEHLRRAGKAYAEAHDLENAFVEYAKAATLVLEKLPSHRDFNTALNEEQRHNLGLVSSMFLKESHIFPYYIAVWSIGTRWDFNFHIPAPSPCRHHSIFDNLHLQIHS
jgi:STAM-binding protein